MTRDQAYLVQMPVPLAPGPIAVVGTRRVVFSSNWQPRALELPRAAAARNAGAN